MSKISLKPNASGTGVFSLEAPNSNVDRTLTLRDETGDLVTTATDLEPQVKDSLNATGSAPVYACRAWVNFDGTGTVSIRESGNVSSVTDVGTGDYAFDLTTAMPDNDYVWSLSGQRVGSGESGQIMAKPAGETGTPTTSNFRFMSFNSLDDAVDYSTLCVAIFR